MTIKITASYMTTSLKAFVAISLCSSQCACISTDHAFAHTQEYASPSVALKQTLSNPENSHRNVNEILEHIPHGSDIRMSFSGDIDNDGDEDALVVLQKPGTEHRLDPRTLVILQRDLHGKLVKRAEGIKAISCTACGGMFGDPLQKIETSRNGFSIRFEGGSRYLWGIEYQFAYEQITNDWFLVEIRDGSLDRLTGDSESRTLNRNDFETVSIGQFDIKEFLSGSFP